MPIDRKQVSEELADLQLEEARFAADQRKQKRVDRANKSAAIEASLKRDRFNQERIQSSCAHRKGGKGVSQMYFGNDANFAVITYTLAHGPTLVICQRCGKTWKEPELLPKKATAEQRAQYRLDLQEYRRALNFPTDNEPGGTVLFSFTPNMEEEALA